MKKHQSRPTARLLALALAVSVALPGAGIAAKAAEGTIPATSTDKTYHWEDYGDKSYWYEDGVRQGTYDDPKGVIGDDTVRGREICDPDVLDELGNGTWFWLDSVYDGAKACNKEVWIPYIYNGEQNWSDEEIEGNSLASGDMAEQVKRAIQAAKDGVTDSAVIGKWVRYDAEGKMIKGWYTVEGTDCDIYPDQKGNTYYYDFKTGLMAKGEVMIDGRKYTFDTVTGVLCGQEEIPVMDSYLSRTVTGLYGTSQNWVVKCAEISEVQQFPYKREGLAYAYQDGADGKLHIVLPSRELVLDMLYPKLGDVIADDKGNFYVVWGRDNESADASVETVFISKYTPGGDLVKSTGFVGRSSPWKDSDSAKTQVPFRAGNCVSAIHDNILVCYHTKQRYDGHQSDQVVAVDIRDMSPYELPKNTYTGHSFFQDVIYSSKTKEFLFASLGDAYCRGLRVNGPAGGYGDNRECTFHCYLQANANGVQAIYNWTYAQLGGIAELNGGKIVLAGASAKSISEDANYEPQNLFIQIFDPTDVVIAPGSDPAAWKGLSESTFVGGEQRSGATSFDTKDNSNSPLTPVTDYGVIWLTDYVHPDGSDLFVVSPQVVVADDKIVLLWNESIEGNSYYMVVSETGEVITPRTHLGEYGLNSYEKPIYYNGEIQWTYCEYGVVKIAKLRP